MKTKLILNNNNFRSRGKTSSEESTAKRCIIIILDLERGADGNTRNVFWRIIILYTDYKTFLNTKRKKHKLGTAERRTKTGWDKMTRGGLGRSLVKRIDIENSQRRIGDALQRIGTDQALPGAFINVCEMFHPSLICTRQLTRIDCDQTIRDTFSLRPRFVDIGNDIEFFEDERRHKITRNSCEKHQRKLIWT